MTDLPNWVRTAEFTPYRTSAADESPLSTEETTQLVAELSGLVRTSPHWIITYSIDE